MKLDGDEICDVVNDKSQRGRVWDHHMKKGNWSSRKQGEEVESGVILGRGDG